MCLLFAYRNIILYYVYISNNIQKRGNNMTSKNVTLNEWLRFVKAHNELFEDRKISLLSALKVYLATQTKAE